MSFRSVLSDGGFRALWSAQVVSKFGDSIHEIALIFLTYQVTGNPILVAAVVVASVVPSAVISPVAGAVVDRVNRKHVLVGTELIRGLAVLAIPLVGRGDSLIPVIVVVAFISGVMEAFFSPARSSVVPNLVVEEELEAANGLSRMTDSASRLLYAFGGVIVAVIGPFGAFFIDAATFVASAGILLFVPTAPCQPTREDEGYESDTLITELMADVREGIQFVRDEPTLLVLLVLSGTTAFALAPFGVVLPFFAEVVLGLKQTSSAITFGSLYAALYAGILLGGAIVGGLAEGIAKKRETVILAGVFATGTGLGITAVIPLYVGTPLLAAAGALVGTGAAISAIQVPVSSLAQATVPDDRRGRLFSLMTVPALLAPPVSVTLVGPFLDLYGPVAVLLGEAIIMIVLGVSLWYSPLRGGFPDWGSVRTAITLTVIGAVFIAGTTGMIDLAPVPVLLALGGGGAAAFLFGVAVERTDFLDRIRLSHPILAEVASIVLGVVVALIASSGFATVLSVSLAPPTLLVGGGLLGVSLGILPRTAHALSSRLLDVR